MKIAKELNRVAYKGHSIRRVEDVIGNVFCLIDNDKDEVSDSPKDCPIEDFSYCSIQDCKRAINNEMMQWVTEVYQVRKDEYDRRFQA